MVSHAITSTLRKIPESIWALALANNTKPDQPVAEIAAIRQMGEEHQRPQFLSFDGNGGAGQPHREDAEVEGCCSFQSDDLLR